MNILIRIKEKTKKLKTDIFALYFAYKDPRVPWYAKILILLLLGYLVSPIDLIPDFIPVIGYLDDLLIFSLTIYILIRLIPKEVFQECKDKASNEPIKIKSKWPITFLIIVIWIVVFYILIKFLFF